MPKGILCSQRNCLFWTCFSKLYTEDILMRFSLDAASYFFLSIYQLSEQKFLEKGSLTKTCRESVTQLALLLLVSISKHTIIQPMWPWPTLILGIFLAWHLRTHQGIALGVYKPICSTLALLTLLGSLGELSPTMIGV